MRLLIYSDVHWCVYSSILRERGEIFSKRLENLIKSVNWAEGLAIEKQCDRIYCLGDFFDQSVISAEELTALNEVKWSSSIPHYFITGNHEAGSKDLYMNSLETLGLSSFIKTIKAPEIEDIDNCEFIYLPYSQEYNLDWVDVDRTKCRILFSHIDIKGIQMGPVISKVGYEIEELDKLCSIGFNGHIHNRSRISSKLLNVGNLTGQNFSEDGLKYSHGVYLFDTDTKELVFEENPYALNFYKLDLRNKTVLPVDKLKNAVLSVQAFHSDKEQIEKFISDVSPVAYRVSYEYEPLKDNECIDVSQLVATDYLKRFADYMQSIDSSEIMKEELEEVLK